MSVCGVTWSSCICSSSFNPRRKTYPSLARKIIRQWKVNQEMAGGCESLIQLLSVKRMPLLAQEVFLHLKSEGFQPNYATLSSLMLCYVHNRLLPQANLIWEEMLDASFVPDMHVVSELFDAYVDVGVPGEVLCILDQLDSRNFDVLSKVYSLAVSCFAKGGYVQLMHDTVEEMVNRRFPVDSATGTVFIKTYCALGSLTEMEAAYSLIKKSGHILEEEAIRAVSYAYIREGKFYKLGEFLRDVGLNRKNVGNLLWNLLLLSYAANFKMKSMQREFLRMLEAGFAPDLTTFNIRALAFSRMSLFWDLHLSIEHMKHEGVAPDLVTYGCVVDAYLDKRLGKNLDFALSKFALDESPAALTDPIVFEALGKGDFHSSSEQFLEFKRKRKWTYRELVSTYRKKAYRRDCIFWNY